MMNGWRQWILFITIFLFLLPGRSIAGEDQIRVNSQYLEYHVPTKKVLVHGDVALTKSEFRLTSDDMELDLESGNGLANGNVHIYMPQGSRLDTEILEFNINTGLWRIQEPEIWLKPSGHIFGDKAEKTDPNTIYLIKPRFTTCSGKNPPWEIKGKTGFLKPGRSMKIRHLSIWVKGAPVFYLPSAYLPIWETGKTGMQPPEAGHSSRHGFFLKNRFSWPIAKHTTGDLYLDFFTKTGIGLGTGWTFDPKKDGQGSNVKFYLLREDSPEEIHGKADFTANLGRSERSRGVVDVHYATERDYDHRFSSDPAIRDLQIGESRAFASVRKAGLDFMAEWEHLRSLLDPNNKSDLHQLPKLACHYQLNSLTGSPKRISPFWGFDLSGVHLDWDMPAGKGEGEQYAIEPRLGLQIPGDHWANLNTLFSARQTYYQNHSIESDQNQAIESDDWLNAYALNMIFTGPRLYRNYGIHAPEGIDAPMYIKHLFYLQIAYEYKTNKGSQPLSIMEPYRDTNDIENVRFILVNRIWKTHAKHSSHFRPILDMILSQVFQIKHENQVFEVRIISNPHPLLRFNGRGYFFTEGRDGEDLDTEMIFGNANTGEISVGWRYFTPFDLDPNIMQMSPIDKLNTGRFVLTSPGWKGYRFQTSLIYDFESDDRIEEGYSLFYEHVCWKGSLSYIRHINEDVIRVNLNLIF